MNLPHGDAILQRLPAQVPGRIIQGAEIGVAAGELSAYLLERRPDLHLLMVDSWEARDEGDPYYQHCLAVGDPNGTRTTAEVERDAAAARAVVARFPARASILRTSSIIAAREYADNALDRRTFELRLLDFVFIDADHRYEAALADAMHWMKNVKRGGWIGGHDYDRFRDGGVKRAVDDFAEAMSMVLETAGAPAWTWFARPRQQQLCPRPSCCRASASPREGVGHA